MKSYTIIRKEILNKQFMRFISESILDDYTPEESNSAVKIAQSTQAIYSKEVHPGEYQFCILIEWMPVMDDNSWVEDILAVYTSRFSICLLKSKEDVRRISKNVSFDKFVPFDSWDNANVYAFLEFDVPSNRKNTLMLLMLNLMTTGECMTYWIGNPKEPVYFEKSSSNYSIVEYVSELFKGRLIDSRYKETVAIKLYQFCHPNELKRFFAEVEKSQKFVNKMCRLYKDLMKNRVQNAVTRSNS